MIPSLRSPLLLVLAFSLLPGLLWAEDTGLKDRLSEYVAPLPGFSADSIRRRIEAMPLSDVEGIWQLTDDGGTVAIVADGEDAGRYMIVVVDSPDRSVHPGTVIGMASHSALAKSYDAWMFTSISEDGPGNAKRFTLRLNADTSLSFITVNKGMRLNLWRLLPYMFRHSVRQVNDRARDLDGAQRIFPRGTSAPVQPRYL